MYVAIVPNRKSKPAVLLRESYREGGKVKNRTLANISHLQPDKIDLLKRVLSGEQLVGVNEAVEPIESLPAGHVRAVLGTMKKLGIPELLSTRPSRERDLVLGMIAEQVLDPASKLGTVRLWQSSTLAAWAIRCRSCALTATNCTPGPPRGESRSPASRVGGHFDVADHRIPCEADHRFRRTLIPFGAKRPADPLRLHHGTWRRLLLRLCRHDVWLRYERTLLRRRIFSCGNGPYCVR
mgnify:CR=1 FL=1